MHDDEASTTARVALITGGAKGIGRALARSLADDGWSVAFCWRSSRAEAEALATELEGVGARALAEQCDVSDAEACAALVAKVHGELGRIDALVNCAGPYHRAPLLEETVEGWNEMFDHNLHPVFYLSKLVAPIFRAQGFGRILTFSMANADRMLAQPHVTAHYIAKSGLLILTRTLAKILGKDGVTVNAISPGFIDSGSAPADELERMVKNIPAGYIGDLNDAVFAARFLLSDEARYVNGANLQLSGGWGI
jgi:3-oxoacyl-[acyl-carrier protein] reductase